MQGHTLSENALSQIAEMKRQLDILVNERPQPMPHGAIFRNYVGYVGGTAITAADYSGTPDTFGSGTVTLYYRNSSNEFVTVKDGQGSDVTVTAYNYADTASGTNTYVWVGQDSMGTWYYLNEAC